MNEGHRNNGATGEETTDELLPLYEAMKEYDMSKPIIVTLISDENDEAEDCNDFHNPLNSDRINNGEVFILEESNRIMNNCIKNQSITENLHDFDNNPVRARMTSAQQMEVKRIAGNNNTKIIPRLSSIGNGETSSFNNTQMNKVSSIPQLLQNSFTAYQHHSSSGTSSSSAYDNPNHNEISNRSETSLRQVSKNLVAILKAYITYATISIAIGTDSPGINEATIKFNNIKMHYFYMSRDIIIRELLPNLQNKCFVRAFLDETANIAIYEENINCSFEDIESIYNWMINRYRQGCGPDSQLNSYPTEILRNVSESSLNPRLLPESNAQTRLFTYGNPDHEVSLNIDTNILNRIKNNEMTKKKHVIVRNKNISDNATTLKQKTNFIKTVPIQTSYQLNSKIQQHQQVRPYQQNLQIKQQQQGIYGPRIQQQKKQMPYQQESEIKQKQQIPYHYVSQIQQQKEQRPYEQHTQMQQQQTRMPYRYDSQIRQHQEQRPYEHESQIQIQQQQISYHYDSQFQHQHEQRPYQQESHIQQQQKKTYNGSQIQSNQEQIHGINDMDQQGLQIQPQQPQNPVRSVSRDSGFMSPNREQIGDYFNGELNAQEVTTPYITHVTSLNPHVTYIPPGSCKVCGANTSAKCRGCFQIYYCDHTCQALDWSRHKMDCRF